MARMLQSGKRTISVGAMQPKDLQRSGDFDPVIGYAEDPERVSVTVLDCSHYQIIEAESGEMAAKMRSFLGNLD